MILLAAGATALVVAACGQAAALTAESPDQAVVAALQKAQTTPLRMSLTGDLRLSTAGLGNLPSSLQGVIGRLGGGGSASGELDQQSAARRQLTLSAAGHRLTLVEYDGHGYVSRDGGSFGELSKTLPTSPTLSPSQVSALVGAAGFEDQGRATVDGVSAEHYSAPLTVATLEKLVQASGTSGATATGRLEQALVLLAPFIAGHGTADVWLSLHDGSLVRAALSGAFTVDVGAAASALAGLSPTAPAAGSLPTGTLGVSVSAQADVSGYGGPVTVTKPQASSTLPAAPTGGWPFSLSD